MSKDSASDLALDAKHEVPRGSMVSVESDRALAEVKAAIFLARQYPRDEVRATERIVADCADAKIAEKATYTYARGGTDISGPSIRLAELLARRWGNLQFGVRELEQRRGESIVEAYAWDTEANVRDAKTFTVRHEIGLKGGAKKHLSDPRDVYELVANQGARRKRAAILALIPAHVVDAAVTQVAKTLALTFQVTPDSIKGMCDTFAGYGVSRAQIEARIQRRVEAITPALMVQMKGILNSLADGMSVPADHFAPDGPAPSDEKPAKDRAKDHLRAQAAAGEQPAREEAVATAPEPSAPVDEALERDEMRKRIAERWKGNDAQRKETTMRLYAKATVPELTTAQMRDFLEKFPAATP